MKSVNFDIVGGRAFLLTFVSFFANSIMRWFDKLDNPTYGMIMTGTVIAFIAKSSVDAHTAARAETQKVIAQKQAETPPSVVEQVVT